MSSEIYATDRSSEKIPTSDTPLKGNNDPNMFPVPTDWINCGCCAFTCCYCDFPKCCGSKNAYNCCLCLRGEDNFCKVLDDPKFCCIWVSGIHEYISCNTNCIWYHQYFCFECILNCAGLQPSFYKNPTYPLQMDTVTPNTLNTYVSGGYFCSVSSCNCDFPNNCQVYGKGVSCCCYEYESVRCKPICDSTRYGKSDVCCLAAKTNETCGTANVCCKCLDQRCCMDSRCAIPCDEDVPCTCGLIPFCLILPKFGCCLKLADILPPPVSNSIELGTRN